MATIKKIFHMDNSLAILARPVYLLRTGVLFVVLYITTVHLGKRQVGTGLVRTQHFFIHWSQNTAMNIHQKCKVCGVLPKQRNVWGHTSIGDVVWIQHNKKKTSP